ncbi:MAG: hypothetical protein L0I76_05705 [Pseudonocardia sp.]|nr:hypothetical protein [Pseudonocardia sp.]
MRGTWERVRGGVTAAVCATVLAGLTAGCAQPVPGTPFAEGEGPPAAAAGAGDEPASGTEPGSSPLASSPQASSPQGTPSPGVPSPPTSFTVPGTPPSGRPTVTVQPVPGAPTTRSPMPVDDPPSGLQAPPAPTILLAPDASGQYRRTVAPHRSRSATATPGPAPRETASPAAPRSGTPRPAAPRSESPGLPEPNSAGPGTPVPGVAGPLTSDVVPDECLLDAKGFGALLGTSVPAPANHEVTRPGGATTRSCFATASSGSPAATAAVNVYRVNAGAPLAFLRAATGSRPLPGIGDGAVLVDTVGGPTLQIATPRLLVTIAAADRSPSDDAWRAAGRAAVATLQRR